MSKAELESVGNDPNNSPMMMNSDTETAVVEENEVKKSQPTLRDNIFAFCIVFCQLVQVCQPFNILAFDSRIQLTSKNRLYHTAQVL